MGARDVFVVRQQLKKKIGLMALGTERKGADRRDTVVPLIGGMNRGLPARGKGASAGGRELEARLVGENQMGVGFFSLFFLSAGPWFGPSARWLLRRALERDIRVFGCSSSSAV